MADVAEKYGSGEIRLTVEQNIIFPNVPDAKVEAMLKEPLLQKFTPFPGKVMAGLVSCTGNQFCGFGQVETKRNAWQARVGGSALAAQGLPCPRVALSLACLCGGDRPALTACLSVR